LLKGDDEVKTYVFKVEVEPDEDGWRAFYPPLEEIGASTWGYTKEEALKKYSGSPLDDRGGVR
jgi:hypothetical protein